MGVNALISTSQDDERRRRVVWSIPTPLGVLGTTSADSAAHLMTISWFVPVANEPSQILFSLEASSRSAENLRANAAATISLLHRDDRALARQFVKSHMDEAIDPDHPRFRGQNVLKASNLTYYLGDAVAVVSGSVSFVRELSTHSLWLLVVEEVGATNEVLSGSASAHAVPILGVHDTRMNYGR
jgi:flavin reductase (DIM6/NTAB) family NADH-FMN oxidoreductase RutF